MAAEQLVLEGTQFRVTGGDGGGFDGSLADLARDEGEIREWILYGRPRRLQEQRAARFLLDRQPIKMPAYQGHVTEAELGELLAYIRWVRQHPY